jgi:hypothetical protein
MFKPTQPLLKASRRLRLSTKQANTRGGYYKGNRTGSQGWHTIWGGYVVDLRKVRTYVPPADFGRMSREEVSSNIVTFAI